jgi:hypothetical protein
VVAKKGDVSLSREMSGKERRQFIKKGDERQRKETVH